VVTGGIGTFTPQWLDALAGFENRGLAYFVPKPNEYRDRDVVIVGGDSAFDWALSLLPVARTVTLHGWIDAVEVLHKRERSRLKAQAVVAAMVFTADMSALESWGLAVSDRRLVVDTAAASRACRAAEREPSRGISRGIMTRWQGRISQSGFAAVSVPRSSSGSPDRRTRRGGGD
jgi:ferredoxin/flavodoxin---NADP+ reductase